MSNSEHVWTGEKKRRAINSDDLKMRLNINEKYQSKNFHSWLQKRLKIRTGEQILDVGCGTGAQTKFMAEDAGLNGHVTAIDISKDSIETLKKTIPNHIKDRVSAHVLDMGDISTFLDNNFKDKNYTLAQSSYAIYYSPKRLEVLKEMQKRTAKTGRVSIFTPCPKHGMIDFCSKFYDISEPVMDSLNFGEDILRPLFRKSFWEVEVHYFQSKLSISNFEDFKFFYEASTYYNESASEEVYEGAKNEIKKNGILDFDKCGILLIGTGVREYCI